MHRSGDHRVGAAVAQRFGCAKHGDQLDARIQPFCFKETQLVRGESGKTGVADKIDGSDTYLHYFLQLGAVRFDYAEFAIVGQTRRAQMASEKLPFTL